MRAWVGILFGLALVPPSASAEPAGIELVAQIAAGRAAGTGLRLAAHGLRIRRSLAEGLPAGAMAARFGRIVLLQAPDSVAALRALESLALGSTFDWVELNAERRPALERVEPWTRGAAARGDSSFPSDPMFRDTRQWGLWNAGPEGVYGGLAGADVQALSAWSMSRGDASILLAVADTGIDPDHPELQQRLPGGARLAPGVNLAGDPTEAIADSFGHGTPVAGVMAARTHEGPHFDSLGVAGVCGGDGAGNPGCRILPIKIAPGRTGTATSFAIAQAILHAASRGARAINVSFAGGGPSRVERLAMHEALLRGCVVVAAAGNQGARAPSAPQYPAAYAAEGLGIQVGASDPFDRRAAFSSHGPGLDLLAPGVDIWTTWMTYPNPNGVPGRGYARVAGTSFATPFVTGAVGLLAASRPELSDVDVQRVLRASARDIGPPGVDTLTGWGRLDIAAALRSVSPDIGIWHDEVAATSMLHAGVDSLWVGEGGFGTLDRWRGRHLAERLAVSASVAVPDSFIDSVRVWPRIAGTTSLRGDWLMPYFVPRAEAEITPARRITLRGHVYRVLPDAAGMSDALHDPEDPEHADRFIPLPPDQARFAFTVIGRVDRRRRPMPEPAAPDARAWARVSPNPARAGARIEGPAGADLDIVDLSGRRVVSARLDAATGQFHWDGRDRHGRRVPHGLYFVKVGQAAAVKLVTID